MNTTCFVNVLFFVAFCASFCVSYCFPVHLPISSETYTTPPVPGGGLHALGQLQRGEGTPGRAGL